MTSNGNDKSINLSQADQESCSMGQQCVGVRKLGLGRAVYLLTEERRQAGICKGCEEENGRTSFGHHLAQPQSGLTMIASFDEEAKRNGFGRNISWGKNNDEITSSAELDIFGPHVYFNPDAALRGETYSIEGPAWAVVAGSGMSTDFKQELLSAFAISSVIPSTSGPEPERALSVDGQTEKSLLSSEWAHQQLTASSGVMFSKREGLCGDLGIPESYLTREKGWDARGGLHRLLSLEEIRAVFGEHGPMAVADTFFHMAKRLSPGGVSNSAFMMTHENVLAKDSGLRGSTLDYMVQISEGIAALHRMNMVQGGGDSRLSDAFRGFLMSEVDLSGVSTRAEALSYLLKNAENLDDFLTSPEFLEFVDEDSRIFESEGQETKLNPEVSVEQAREKLKMKDVLLKIRAATDLLDKKWRESLAKNPIEALKERFGHPVGIPTEKLRPWHFVPGGYLVESGWLKIEESTSATGELSAAIPVDSSGKPDPSMDKWAAMKPSAKIRPLSTPEGIGDLAKVCAEASELWWVSHNRGLPRDSLFMGAALCNLDKTPTGVAAGGNRASAILHPLLSDIEIPMTADNLGKLPTMASKITAVSEALYASNDPAEKDLLKKIMPRGGISGKEMDLANWRISSMSDLMLGNEYGLLSSKKDGLPESADLTKRSAAEEIQEAVLSLETPFGMNQAKGLDEREFFRPLVGVARGEAARLFLLNPGKFMRRSGSVRADRPGPAKAFFEQVKAPLAPSMAFRDPLTGEATDGSDVAQFWGGHHFVFPYSILTDRHKTTQIGGFAAEIQKVTAVSAGRYAEKTPKRWRFAGALSFGEMANHGGLLDPRLGKGGAEMVETTALPGKAREALFTKDVSESSPLLAKAPWNKPELLHKDFMAGPMGSAVMDAHKKGGDKESKKAMQAALHASLMAKHIDTSEYAKFTWNKDDWKGLTYPADWAFGNLQQTAMTGEVHFIVKDQWQARKAVGSFAEDLREKGNAMGVDVKNLSFAEGKQKDAGYDAGILKDMNVRGGQPSLSTASFSDNVGVFDTVSMDVLQTSISAYEESWRKRKNQLIVPFNETGIMTGNKGGFLPVGYESLIPFVAPGKHPDEWHKAVGKKLSEKIHKIGLEGTLDSNTDGKYKIAEKSQFDNRMKVFVPKLTIKGRIEDRKAALEKEGRYQDLCLGAGMRLANIMSPTAPSYVAFDENSDYGTDTFRTTLEFINQTSDFKAQVVKNASFTALSGQKAPDISWRVRKKPTEKIKQKSERMNPFSEDLVFGKRLAPQGYDSKQVKSPKTAASAIEDLKATVSPKIASYFAESAKNLDASLSRIESIAAKIGNAKTSSEKEQALTELFSLKIEKSNASILDLRNDVLAHLQKEFNSPGKVAFHGQKIDRTKDKSGNDVLSWTIAPFDRSGNSHLAIPSDSTTGRYIFEDEVTENIIAPVEAISKMEERKAIQRLRVAKKKISALKLSPEDEATISSKIASLSAIFRAEGEGPRGLVRKMADEWTKVDGGAKLHQEKEKTNRMKGFPSRQTWNLFRQEMVFWEKTLPVRNGGLSVTARMHSKTLVERAAPELNEQRKNLSQKTQNSFNSPRLDVFPTDDVAGLHESFAFDSGIVDDDGKFIEKKK